MSFHKFQANNLFNGHEFLSHSAVLICNQDGVVEDIVDEAQAGDDIQKLNGIITPGFVNCHCHLELSHMKGLIPEGTGLIDFVFSIVTQRHFPDEEILEGIKTAEEEMIANGIVAVGDISNNRLTQGQKGQKNIRYYNFVEASGWLPEVAEQRFSRSQETFQVFSKISATSIVPHAPYSVSDNLWRLIQPYFQDKVVSIHNQETSFEDELFLQNSGDFVRMYEMMKLDTSFFIPSGKSSLQTYFDKLEGAAHVILVHNTFTKEADILYINNARPPGSTSFCLCVNANQYIEKALPPIDLFRTYGCDIILGTDSLASNHSLSIVDEIKTIHQQFPSIPLAELLTWGTSNGAKALKMEHTLGSFAKGKRPGVILLEGVDPKRSETIQTATLRRLL